MTPSWHERLGEFLLAPQTPLRAAVRRASELPFLFYEGGINRCVSRLDAGWFVAHPVVRGPRRVRLAYGKEGNFTHNVVDSAREKLVGLSTAPFVRCAGTRKQGVAQMAEAMEWPGLSDPILRIGGFTSFVVDVSREWCIVSIWSERNFMSWAFPVRPTSMSDLRQRLMVGQEQGYRRSTKKWLHVEVFDGGASPPDVGRTRTLLETEWR